MLQSLWALCHVDDSFDAPVVDRKGGQILWFDDQESLLDYLSEGYITLLADVGELDEDLEIAARERFLDRIELFGLEQVESLIEALNDLTIGLRRIIWLGPLADLAEREDEFANGLRAHYWRYYVGDDEDPTAAIPIDEWEDFIDCANEYLVEGRY